MGKNKNTPPPSAPAKTGAPAATGPLRAGAPLRIGLILALALSLRLFSLGWGIPTAQHFAFHPDEIAGALTVRTLWQDPHHLETTRFANMKGVGFFYFGMAALMLEAKLGLLGAPATIFATVGSTRMVFLTLRALTVAFSMGTVLLVFLIGRKLFRSLVGELAALLEAVSPISVINAHYIKIDCAESFLVMLVLYFTVRSITNRYWTLAAVFASGVAAAFKYPGGSAILFPLAAAFLVRKDRARRLKLLAAATPLFALGFFTFFPSALINGLALVRGASTAAGNAYSGSALTPLGLIALYPFRLMQGVGVVLPAWALAAVVWWLRRRRWESRLILAWLLPYGAIMSSSAVVLIRYSVPMMPACALLMAGFIFDLAALKPGWVKKGSLPAATVAAIVPILAVTLIHLHTMTQPDPRELAGQWIREHVPAGESIAITPSHKGDQFFTVPVSYVSYRVTALYFRPNADTGTFLDGPFNYLATNEIAWIRPQDRDPSQRRFWAEVKNPRLWELAASFSNRPAWPGILFRGTMPEDMYYLYQETRIYRRVR